MKSYQIKKHLFFLVLWGCMILPVYGKTSLLTENTSAIGKYKVSFEKGVAFISRDGSEATPVKNGTILSKPGSYFISFYEKGVLEGIHKVTVLRQQTATTVTIKQETELEEVLKGALEDFIPTLKLNFAYGTYNMEELSALINKTIDRLVETYPKLTYQGNRMKYAAYNNPSLKVEKPVVELSFIYPLQVKNTLKLYDQSANQKIVQILKSCLEKGMSDYQIELALADYIIQNVEYSDNEVKGESYANPTLLSHTLYGALIDGKAVCDGYAHAMRYLLNAAGVPTKLVIGTTLGNVGHAWNLVKIQGAYYHLDTTWADEDKPVEGVYNYFNEQDSFMENTHTWERIKYPKAISLAYTIPYMPVNFKATYKIEKNNQVSEAISDFQKKKLQAGTFILKNVNEQRWKPEQILKQMVDELGRSISYTCYYKYNCFVVTFEI
ncbi:hypothetical protein CS063_05090 [Sporanaerobium hydrogeniformans]|uniref:Uncharacterized protein n=1 Tax=Sporanaerobium hydrogeniformans TaxID=3072179 RepID=A0AC61DFC8_9FIRM|nr:transglutaminase domain-containing protein [Sporanaerobium hydrogeniformans]PHV71426.1 hypothetical protein CS063_05090 [Sporanaerobium hydrogeniformans]